MKYLFLITDKVGRCRLTSPFYEKEGKKSGSTFFTRGPKGPLVAHLRIRLKVTLEPFT